MAARTHARVNSQRQSARVLVERVLARPQNSSAIIVKK